VARTTPRVHGDTLTSPDGGAPIRVGEPAWYAWLEAATTFAFASSAGSFTARKERGGRAGQYWKAYRTRAGLLRRAYLGKSVDLTLERLNDVAAELARPDVERRPESSGVPARPSRGVLATSADLLLTTKLFPPPCRPNLISRPRLSQRLEVGTQGKLTLVAAAAGFGKTTLLSEWIASRSSELRVMSSELALTDATLNPQLLTLNFKVAWVSLDSGVNDPVRFWSHVIAALDRLLPGVGAPALAALQSPQPPPTTLLLINLLNALNTLPVNTVLVLDDYHVITTRSIHDALVFLLDHVPPRLHLVIASRTDPPLPLALLRARGELTELRAADLRFTADEAAAFLNQAMVLPLNPTDVAALEMRTEGWIAGLQLAALAMRNHSDVRGFIAAFTGSNRFVVDYLVAEVLDRLPAELQRFVLETAILDRMCGPLCDYVTETENETLKIEKNVGGSENAQCSMLKAQWMLENLERANLFIIPLDDERRWYRYHHLFADVARARLHNQRDSAAVAQLYSRASAWYEQQTATDGGLSIAEVVRYALLGQNWERVAGLIEQYGMLLMLRGEVQTVLGWLNIPPESVIRSRPSLCVIHGLTLLLTNQLEASETRLRQAEQGIQPATPPDRARAILGRVATIRALKARYTGDLVDCLALSRQALDLLPAGEVAMLGSAHANLSYAYLVSGDVTPAVERAAAAAIAVVRDSGNVFALVRNITTLARLQVLQGRLKLAAATYADAARLEPGLGDMQALYASPNYYFGLGDLLREWNDMTEAERYLTYGIHLTRETVMVDADSVALGYVALARVQQARGQSDSALAMLHECVRMARERSFASVIRARVLAWQAQLWLAQEQLPAALRWLEESELHPNDDLGYPREEAYLILARVRIAERRFGRLNPALDDVLDMLRRLLASAEVSGRMGSAIQIRILLALAFQAQGDLTAAGIAIEPALALAAPEGYVRSFVDEGAPMAELLAQSVVRSAQSDPSRAYAERLLSAFPEVQSVALRQAQEPRSAQSEAVSVVRPSLDRSIALVEPLTAREIEVLRLIADGASNRAIAEQLVITVGTVKRHINNLFDKLGVRSRTQAIRAARARRLVE
jgi:LuxR family maltose regulon positive regulatory protein